MQLVSDKSSSCLNCGRPLKGRLDKKFCHPGCKNEYNNHKQRLEREVVGSIDLILHRNRRVLLDSLDGKSMRQLSQRELLQRGLRFDYFTHLKSNPQGDQYRFCYDHGYLMLSDNTCLVVSEPELPAFTALTGDFSPSNHYTPAYSVQVPNARPL